MVRSPTPGMLSSKSRVEGNVCELVISYGKTGHIALYRFLSQQNLIRILTIRNQRELDYLA